MQPHRGVMILVFGILGLVTCQIFSVVAWVMGKSDLAEMDAGRMDPEGRGLTKAGYVLGIIGALLFVVGMLFAAVMVAFVLLSNAR